MFYGPDLGAIHHGDFGVLAETAAVHLVGRLHTAGLRSGTVVDLGCGSGTFARLVSDAGYDVVGVDISSAMVELARAHAPLATFTVGSIFDFELPSQVIGVVALGEVLNYAADPRAGLSEVAALAARVRAALVPNGVFLFDVSTPGRGTRDVLHQRDDWVLFMHAEEATDGSRLDRRITIFREVPGGELYRRSDEHHVEVLHRPADIVEALHGAGLDPEVLDRYEGGTTMFGGWIVVESRPR